MFRREVVVVDEEEEEEGFARVGLLPLLPLLPALSLVVVSNRSFEISPDSMSALSF